MGLHQRHTHGRVFRGLAAREQLEIHKRDSHGSDIKMHVPADFQQKQTADDSGSGGDDAVQVVYVTLSQTFAGPAVYSTMTDDDSNQIASSSAAAANSVLKGGAIAATRSAESSSALETSVATVSPAQSRSAATTLATATSSISTGDAMESYSSTAIGSPVRATQSSTASSQATTEQTKDTGLSAGGKAGLAIGIILAIGLLSGLIFFFLRKKKRPTNEEALNEKHSSFPRGAPIGAAAATGAFAARQMQQDDRGYSKRDSSQTEKVPASVRSTRTASTAPRLSLRPITQLMSSFEQRKSGGNALDVAAAGGLSANSAWERRPVNSGNDNPFNDTAAAHARTSSGVTDPFDEKRSVNDSTATVNQPKTSWEANEPQTPSSATVGTAAAVPVAAGVAANAAARGPNNVHRVQLDFKPSMDDELELRSGQLVRMLHEYDDGWALCIRMDRSQQGVAPRTCLSKLPVKPRPQGPPGASPQGSRPGTAQSNRGPPNAPGMMVPRPLTPTSSSRSPSPQDAPQVNSVSPPTGPARVQRKPVPGIAM